MPPKLLIVIQPSISHYREPLIRELKASSDFEIQIAGTIDSDNQEKSDSVKAASLSVLQNAIIFKRLQLGFLKWDFGLLKEVFLGKYNSIVIEGNITLVSSWLAQIIAKLRRKKVYLWGHGWRRANENAIKRVARRLFYSLADGHLVYGQRAKLIGVSTGISEEKIGVVYNSIYSEKTLAPAAQGPPGGLIRKYLDIAPENLVLISSSRITHRRRLDLLVEAITKLPATQAKLITVLVIGDGPEKSNLEELSHSHGVDFRFLGPIYDFAELQKFYQIADYCIIPEAGGLNVIQSLGFGCPVIISSNLDVHGPEAEAVVDSATGFTYDGDSDIDLTNLLGQLVDGTMPALDPQDCKALVMDNYTAETHANRLLDFVRKSSSF